MRPEPQCEEANYVRRRPKFGLTLPVWQAFAPADPARHAIRLRGVIPFICEH